MQNIMQPKRSLRILGLSFLMLASIFILALILPPSAFAESAGQYVDDAAITAKIKAAYLADDRVKTTDINVKTDHGAVQLTGAVDSQDEEGQAVRLAYGVNGVQVVLDKLTIRNPPQSNGG
jgi:hypothetical protein